MILLAVALLALGLWTLYACLFFTDEGYATFHEFNQMIGSFFVGFERLVKPYDPLDYRERMRRENEDQALEAPPNRVGGFGISLLCLVVGALILLLQKKS